MSALVPAGSALRVAACELAGDDGEIVAFVRRHAADVMVVAVDAPLRVPNQTGARPCDRETQRRFGRAGAGAYPANRRRLGRYNGGAPRGEALARRLATLGFVEGALDRAGRGRVLLECYPHPAQVVLFGLRRTLKYKRKRQPWTRARREFRRYLDHVRALRGPRLVGAAAWLEDLDPAGARGRQYKAREDRLDSLLCAYVAALAPRGRLLMLGSVDRGHIVVPRPSRRAG